VRPVGAVVAMVASVHNVGCSPSPVLGSPLPATVSRTTTTGTASTGTTTSSSTTQIGDGVPNTGGCVPSEYQPQKCPILVNGEPVVPYPFQDTKVRPETYYYHPDHLGSTSWVRSVARRLRLGVGG
jgi:hypothetical protein